MQSILFSFRDRVDFYPVTTLFTFQMSSFLLFNSYPLPNLCLVSYGYL